MLVTRCFAVVAVIAILVMMKVPAKNRGLHTARFDTWAQSIVSGYDGLPFHSMAYHFIKFLCSVFYVNHHLDYCVLCNNNKSSPRQKMDSPAACATYAVHTADKSYNSATGTPHPHHTDGYMATLNSLDKDSMTIANSKGLSAEPWCALAQGCSAFRLGFPPPKHKKLKSLLHFSKFLTNPNFNLETNYTFRTPTNRRFQRYIGQMEILLNFLTQYEYGTFLCW